MKTKNACILFLAAFIWGTAFVAQSAGMNHLGPFGFNGLRNLIGCASLLPLIAVRNAKNTNLPESHCGGKRTLLTGGICCGVCLFAGGSLQQIGIQYTTVGKAGFITAFYIVLVPVLGIFLKQRVSRRIWLAVALALTGLYFLCITGDFSIGTGDICLFFGALIFALHILVIDYFAPRTDNVKMSCLQFLVVGLLSIPFILGLETITPANVVKSLGPLLYAGALSCGVAYTLQIVGQRNMNPAIASLILSLESCISVLAGWVLLGQTLSLREGAGCILMFAAIILVQLPDRSR